MSTLKLSSEWYLSAGEILKYVMPSVDAGGETMRARGRSEAERKRNRVKIVKQMMIQLIQQIFHFFFFLTGVFLLTLQPWQLILGETLCVLPANSMPWARPPLCLVKSLSNEDRHGSVVSPHSFRPIQRQPPHTSHLGCFVNF